MTHQRGARHSRHRPAIRFLWHPGTRDIFSGYGLVIGPSFLVGMVMVDRPKPVDPAWLVVIERTFGSYQLAVMTQSGERGIVCQMLIAKESTSYLRSLPYPRIGALRDALLPLLDQPPAASLSLTWHPASQCWVSEIIPGILPLFPLGRVVATPGALRALENAGQEPEEFLNRHVYGDWGEVPEEDKRENETSLHHGWRILSAYTTRAGEQIWVITEADRSATTFLLPSEY